MQAIFLQLFQVFLPIVQKAVADYRAANNGAEPTDAQVLALFNANIDKYLNEGAAWLAAHPRV